MISSVLTTFSILLLYFFDVTRPKKSGTAGFRTGVLLLPRQADCQTFLHPAYVVAMHSHALPAYLSL